MLKSLERGSVEKVVYGQGLKKPSRDTERKL